MVTEKSVRAADQDVAWLVGRQRIIVIVADQYLCARQTPAFGRTQPVPVVAHRTGYVTGRFGHAVHRKWPGAQSLPDIEPVRLADTGNDTPVQARMVRRVEPGRVE